MNGQRLPSFLLVGVPKAGTSSLHQYLRDHPRLFLPRKGELHFFSSSSIGLACEGPGDGATFDRICKTWGDYLGFFANAGPDDVIGEASPSYFFFPECIPELKGALGGDVKLILILRHPVDRAYSNYLHLRRSGRETLTFEEALDREAERKAAGWGDFWRYREHSMYAEKLGQWFDAFSPSNLEVLVFEEMIQNLSAVMARLFEFLGVDPSHKPRNIGIVYNKAGRSRSAMVVRLIRWTGRFGPFGRRMLPGPIYGALRRARDRTETANREGVKERLPEEVRRRLFLSFEDDVLRTERLLGRELVVWREKRNSNGVR